MNAQTRKENRRRVERRSAARVAGDSTPRAPDLRLLWLCGIWAFAFVLRLIYLSQIESIPLFYHLAGDGWTYHEWGMRIAAGDWLGAGVFYQPPLYPYFLGLLHSLFGPSLWAARLVQIALGAAACALIFLAGEKWFSRPVGIAAGLILACYAPAIFFDGLIEKSVLDLFLLALLLFWLPETDPWFQWRWFGAGIILALLGLSRENALVLVPVVALWIAIRFSERPLAVRGRLVGLFVGGVLLVLVPVGLRNLAVGGEFTLTTAQFGPNFFIGNNAAADGTYGSVRKTIGEIQLEGPDAERLAERAVGHELTPGQVSSYWFGQALQYITSQPGDWLRLLGLKWLMVWNAREIEDSDDFYIYREYAALLDALAPFNHFGVLVPLAALGLYLTRGRWRRLWLLYLMIAALALSVAIFYVFGRYRFPLVPLLALFAGAGLIDTVGLWKKRAWSTLALSAAMLFFAALVVNWPLRGKSGPGAEGYNNLSNAYLKQGRIDEAIESARRALAVAPDYGIAHYNLANRYAAQSKLDLAQTHLEKALEIYPNYAEAHSNYGQLLVARGDLEGATRYFQRAVALNPNLGRAQLNLGLALAKQGRIQEAVRPLEAAVRLMPDSAEANYYLGNVYAAENRYGEAAESLRQALRIRASFAPAHESLARLLAAQGKTEEATHHYQEAIRIFRRERPASGAP
jgi:tetratricopeptide (TPR) repeat protein